ncbi:putative RNA polymerase II subunit B1 CTD phosphatase rpap2 [Polymixia lowei]
MEQEQRKLSGRSSKTTRKGGKTVKAKNAEDEARREALKETLWDKLVLEKRALHMVECLLEDSVAEDFLVDCAKFIVPANYKDAIEERSIAKMCGYPVCPNKLDKIPTQQYKISTKTNKVYDITERKCFCSNFCYKASKQFELQISKTPLWLRQHESPPEITLMKKGDGGSSGEVVQLSERCLQEEDIENPQPVNPEDLNAPGRRSPPAGLGHSDSDGEQEPDFVSSVVSRQQGPRVHWGDLPKRSDEGERREGEKKERRKKGEGEKDGEETQRQQREVQCENDVMDEGQREESRRESELGAGRPRQLHAVEEATVKLNSCTITEPVTDTPPLHTDTTLTQSRRLAERTTPASSPVCTDSNPAENRPQFDLPPSPLSHTADSTAQPGQPGLDITQVGMSRRGAAGLRDLLKHHTAGTKADSVRQNLLEGLKRTLKEWSTEETLTFLYGPDRSSGPLLSDRKEEKEEEDEEELDEDDLEEDGGGVGAGRPERPSAPAPDYKALREETQELDLRVREFYKGTWVLPGEAHQSARNSEVTAQDPDQKDPVLPLIDSHAQHIIQKRITVEKLTRSLINIVGPLRITMSDISTDLNNLVRTFRLTSTNIIHKTPQWTLLALLLLHLLSEVSPLVREALKIPASVEYLDMLVQGLSLQRQDLLSLVQLLKTPAH